MSVHFVVWRPGHLRLTGDSGLALPDLDPAWLANWSTVVVSPSFALWVHVDPGYLWWRNPHHLGNAWVPVQLPHDLRITQDTKVRAHLKSKSLSIIQNQTVWIHNQAGWAHHALPEGIRGVDVGPNGRLWAVGSRLAAWPNPYGVTKPTLWQMDANTGVWKEHAVRLSWWQSFKASARGGTGQFDFIDASQDPIVTAEYAEHELEAEWFVYAPTRSGRLDIVHLDHWLSELNRLPDGTPLLCTTSGELWRFTAKGWTPQGVNAPLQQALDALTLPNHGVRLRIYGKVWVARAWARGNHVKAYPQFGLVSTDNGQTWCVELEHPAGEGDILSSFVLSQE